MKIWCLVSHVDKEYGAKLIEDRESDYELVLMDYASLQIKTGDTKPTFYCLGQELEVPDAFWVWTSNTDTRVIENLLLASGAKSIANLREQDVARSKIATYQRLAAANVRVPRTYVFFYHTEREEIEAQFDYPFVVKPDNGPSGQGVALVHDGDELDAYLAERKPGVAYMAQEYVSTSRGRDLRVVMLNGEFFTCFVRQSTNDKEFRSNLHLGGKIVDYELDEQTLEICRKVAALYDLPIIGLDLMFAEDGFVFTEVNSFPGLHKADRNRFIAAVISDFLQREGAQQND